MPNGTVSQVSRSQGVLRTAIGTGPIVGHWNCRLLWTTVRSGHRVVHDIQYFSLY